MGRGGGFGGSSWGSSLLPGVKKWHSREETQTVVIAAVSQSVQFCSFILGIYLLLKSRRGFFPGKGRLTFDLPDLIKTTRIPNQIIFFPYFTVFSLNSKILPYVLLPGMLEHTETMSVKGKNTFQKKLHLFAGSHQGRLLMGQHVVLGSLQERTTCLWSRYLLVEGGTGNKTAAVQRRMQTNWWKVGNKSLPAWLITSSFLWLRDFALKTPKR